MLLYAHVLAPRIGGYLNQEHTLQMGIQETNLGCVPAVGP